jgi:hypothetical protein
MGSEWILGRFSWGVWIGFDWPRTSLCNFRTEEAVNFGMKVKIVSTLIISKPGDYRLLRETLPYRCMCR